MGQTVTQSKGEETAVFKSKVSQRGATIKKIESALLPKNINTSQRFHSVALDVRTAPRAIYRRKEIDQEQQN